MVMWPVDAKIHNRFTEGVTFAQKVAAKEVAHVTGKQQWKFKAPDGRAYTTLNV